MKKLLTVFCVLFGLAFVSTAHSQEITFLEHQKGVNKVMCEIMVKCKEGKTAEECAAELNAISEANPQNSEIKVQKSNSDVCMAFLKTKSCADIMQSSVAGDCEMTKLQAAATTTTTVVSNSPAAVVDSLYQVGEDVMVEWKGKWWAAKVLKAEKDRWFITYPGWSSDWNEWVDSNRIRKK